MCQINILCFDFPAVLFLLALWKYSKEENEPYVNFLGFAFAV